jgi:hypothetical protein
MTFSTAINILDIIGCGLKMACCIVALRYKDIVIDTAFQRLVQGNWGTLSRKVSNETWRISPYTDHEFLFYSTKALESRRKFKMMVSRCLSYSGNNSNIVAFWTDIVRG